jgi:hypothetical protein
VVMFLPLESQIFYIKASFDYDMYGDCIEKGAPHLQPPQALAKFRKNSKKGFQNHPSTDINPDW